MFVTTMTLQQVVEQDASDNSSDENAARRDHRGNRQKRHSTQSVATRAAVHHFGSQQKQDAADEGRERSRSLHGEGLDLVHVREDEGREEGAEDGSGAEEDRLVRLSFISSPTGCTLPQMAM